MNAVMNERNPRGRCRLVIISAPSCSSFTPGYDLFGTFVFRLLNLPHEPRRIPLGLITSRVSPSIFLI